MRNEGQESDLVGDIFGWAGTVISFVFFVTPIVPFIDLIKGKITYKETPGALLICSFMNCILWAVYGVKLERAQVYTANGLGMLITIVWIFIYLVYFSQKNVFKSIGFITLSIIIIAGIGSLFYFVVDPESDKADITGYTAMVFNVLMYAAPGEKIYTVIKTGNYKLLPIFSSVGGFSCSACWLMYGVYQNDINIIIPNGLGLLFAVLQLIVYFVVKHKQGTMAESEIKEKLKGDENDNAQIKPDSVIETENAGAKPDEGKENENVEVKEDAEKENEN